MKRKLVLLQVFVVIIMLCTSVYATLDTTLVVTTNPSTTVYKGDEVEVTLALKDVDSNKKIINIEGYINYNEEIFEKVTYDNVVKNNENKVKIGDEMLPVEKASDVSGAGSSVVFNDSPTTDNDIKILIDCPKGVSKDSDLLTIKFKLKSDVKTGDVENAISYSEFIAKSEDDSSNKISEKINLTVKAKSDDSNKDDEQKNESKNENTKKDDNKSDSVGAVNDKNKNTNANKNANKNNTNTNTSNTNIDDSVSGKKLPAAGAKILVVPAIILIAISYITYNRYIRMRGI